MVANSGDQNSDRFILTIVALCALANICAFGLGRQFWDGHGSGVTLSWAAVMFIIVFSKGVGLHLSLEPTCWVIGICLFFLFFDLIVMTAPAVESARS